MVERTDYPANFYAQREGLRWWVYSAYLEGLDFKHRKAVGPFWSATTAYRVAMSLATHFRNGFDMAINKKEPGRGA